MRMGGAERGGVQMWIYLGCLWCAGVWSVWAQAL